MVYTILKQWMLGAVFVSHMFAAWITVPQAVHYYI